MQGLHAIKVVTDMSQYYPDFDVTVHRISYEYHVRKGSYIYLIGVLGFMVSEDELQNFEIVVSGIVNGFFFN